MDSLPILSAECCPPPPSEPGWDAMQVYATDLHDLVNKPHRSLDVEFKNWRNLDNREDRAELARDIAALANSGGGYIAFGFQEKTLTPADPDPFRFEYKQEYISSIVNEYLDPPVRCDVTVVRSVHGSRHPVIRVSSHGQVPVCIRKDGPVVGGRSILPQGTYYIRKLGPVVHGTYIGRPTPESAPITSSREWAPLIRRCMRHERDNLLGMIEAALEGRREERSCGQGLEQWHRAARHAFLKIAPDSPAAESLARCHYAFSYAFDFVRPEMLDHAQLPEFLRRAVFDVQEVVGNRWSMFDPPYRKPMQTRFVVDPDSGDAETDFLETAWLREYSHGECGDFWRFCPTGRATIIRGYAEDNAAWNQQLRLRPGTWFSPNRCAHQLAELVHHARAIARFFGTPRHVVFRCEWWGISGRRLFDPDARWVYRSSAIDDYRIVTTRVPVAMLFQGWPDLVSQIMAPVIRAFEPELALGPDWVRGQAPHWRQNI